MERKITKEEEETGDKKGHHPSPLSTSSSYAQGEGSDHKDDGKENHDQLDCKDHKSSSKNSQDNSYSQHSISFLQELFQSQLSSSSSSTSTLSHPSHHHGYHYLCLLNGSDLSHIAYEITISLSKKTDTITLFHCYKEDQAILPSPYTAQAVYEKYSNDIQLYFNSNQYHLCWEMRHNHETLLQKLNEYLQLCSSYSHLPHFIILGHASRKHAKLGHHHGTTHEEKGENKKNIHEFGYYAPYTSSCELILRTIQLPLIIAKKPIPYRREKKIWMMAVDGSLYSTHGFNILLRLINPKDTLIIFHVVNDNETSPQLTKIKNYYEEELASIGPPLHQFIFVEQNKGMNLAECIVQYVNDYQKADFFVIRPRARTTASLSPMTEQIINEVDCSIVICKNSG